ncbi:MAG: hypothetical protein KAT66_06165 [Candidatus Lokiarchaeota archaeon]|nr:hypothetical protein [Candidatus Lokiarchaeota archaeon]
MSKIPKDQIKEQKSKIKRRSDDKFAYRTVIISCVLSIIFYAISLLFNVGVISIFTNINILFNMLDLLIKVATILLFFLFMMISVGNYKELTGKPLNWKELLILIVLSLGQTLLNLWVFAFTFIGLLVIIIYLYIVQEL